MSEGPAYSVTVAVVVNRGALPEGADVRCEVEASFTAGAVWHRTRRVVVEWDGHVWWASDRGVVYWRSSGADDEAAIAAGVLMRDPGKVKFLRLACMSPVIELNRAAPGLNVMAEAAACKHPEAVARAALAARELTFGGGFGE